MDTPLVLVVDDEVVLLELTALSLSGAGVEVVKAASGEEALNLLASDVAITHLLSDIRMPRGMNGIELAERAAAIQPELVIVLMSGEGTRPAGVPACHGYLAKPFLHGEMLRALFNHSLQSPSVLQTSLARNAASMSEC